VCGGRSFGDLPVRTVLSMSPPTASGPLVPAPQSLRTDYMGVSVAVGDLANRSAAFVCNRDGRPPRPLTPGAYGVSNGFMGQWPKVEDGLERLKVILAESDLESRAGLAPRPPTCSCANSGPWLVHLIATFPVDAPGALRTVAAGSYCWQDTASLALLRCLQPPLFRRLVQAGSCRGTGCLGQS
jgi:hypothetical protein